MNVPTGLPTLSAGSHEPGSGRACVMEYVALLAGEQWTDSPACTHRALARAAQTVNDYLDDADRHLLVPLIGRLFGTDIPVDDRVFSLRIARTVEHLSPAAKACNDVTEAYLAGKASAGDLSAARADASASDAANAAYATYATYAANAANATNAAAAANVYYAANATCAAAAANVYYAANAANATNAAAAANVYYAANATCAADLVAWLDSIIDIYDDLSGRTQHRVVTDDDLAVLAAAVQA